MRATASADLPPELAELPRFPSVDGLYSENGGRRSPEWDYGVLWRTRVDDLWPLWRVSWVVETGDVYASRTSGRPLVLVLGNVPASGDYPYAAADRLGDWREFWKAQPVEQLLAGWAEITPPVLSWVVGRLA